jgi:ribonuclease BN (tRNA processing enzyme)
VSFWCRGGWPCVKRFTLCSVGAAASSPVARKRDFRGLRRGACPATMRAIALGGPWRPFCVRPPPTLTCSMQIRVLGCSGSIAAGSRTTSFLLDDDVLIDAGTGVGDLSLDELARVDHIFITHSHLDHVLAIGLLADSVTRRRLAAQRPAVQVHGLAPTLQALQQHIFNGVIWPDFTRLPTPDAPVLALVPLAIGDRVALGQRTVEVLPASHTVPACGYAVLGAPGGAWVFTGDTGPNAALWARLRELPVQALVVETAFGNDEVALAEVSQHLCPSRLQQELAQFSQPAQVYITHIKPGEVDAVMTEIAVQGSSHTLQALQTGQVMRLR